MRQFGRRIGVKDLQNWQKIDIKRGLMGRCLILRPPTSSLLHFINSSANENAAYCGKWTGWKVVRKVQDQQNLAQSAKTAWFLFACTRLYKLLCRSVGLSVGRSLFARRTRLMAIGLVLLWRNLAQSFLFSYCEFLLYGEFHTKLYVCVYVCLCARICASSYLL